MLLHGIFQYNWDTYVIWNRLCNTFNAREGPRILGNTANLVTAYKKDSEEFIGNICSSRMSIKIYQKSIEQEICHKSFCYKMVPSINKVLHQFEPSFVISNEHL